MTKQLNPIEKLIQKIDKLQQKTVATGFVVAVIKRFGDENAGYLGALITYYGFLSLFPLLLVLTSILDIVASGNPEFQARVLDNVSSYIPILGEQLQQNITSPSGSGVALVAGLIFTFYGARGGADAFRHAVNSLWHTPKKQLLGFPNNYLNSFYITILGGIGLLASAALATYASSLGDYVVFQVLSLFVSLILLTLTFFTLFRLTVTKDGIHHSDLIIGSFMSAICILALQLIGSYILARQLKNLTNLYGTFALVLGLLFWIYLQVKLVLFSVVANIVQKYRAYPVSIVGDENTTESI